MIVPVQDIIQIPFCGPIHQQVDKYKLWKLWKDTRRKLPHYDTQLAISTLLQDQIKLPGVVGGSHSLIVADLQLTVDLRSTMY